MKKKNNIRCLISAGIHLFNGFCAVFIFGFFFYAESGYSLLKSSVANALIWGGVHLLIILVGLFSMFCFSLIVSETIKKITNKDIAG